jgi:DNA-binding transcriptional ArsR family regulator
VKFLRELGEYYSLRNALNCEWRSASCLNSPLSSKETAFIEAIGNPSRLKILLVLWKSDKELTVYKICQRTGLGRSAVSRHLGNLVEAGIVSKKIYGEIPLYAMNKDDIGAAALTEFFYQSEIIAWLLFLSLTFKKFLNVGVH